MAFTESMYTCASKLVKYVARWEHATDWPDCPPVLVCLGREDEQLMGKTTREKPKNEIATCTYDYAIHGRPPRSPEWTTSIWDLYEVICM